MSVFIQLLLKDARSLFRSPHVIIAAVGFGVLLMALAGFAFRTPRFGADEMLILSPGALWLAFLFSGVLVLAHGQRWEGRAQALIGVGLSPVDSSLVFVAKFLVNLLFVLFVESVIIAAHALFFSIGLGVAVVNLYLVVLLFDLGFVSLGTILSLIATGSHERELLFPLIFFPLLLPLAGLAIELSRNLLLSGVLAFFPSVVLAVISAVFFVCSVVLFEFVLRV